MIGMLSGSIESVSADIALIDVHGVGFEVRMPSAELMTLHTGAAVKLFTSLNVSQDAVTLYGFTSMASKRMFLQLQKVSGIGPRVALSLISTLPADKLIAAVTQGDAAALAKAPGLGKKGAQKIILELSGSLKMDDVQATGLKASAHRDEGTQQVIDGLQSLGWKEPDAVKAVEQVCKEHSVSVPLVGADIPAVLKLALSSLDRGL